MLIFVLFLGAVGYLMRRRLKLFAWLIIVIAVLYGLVHLG